VLGSLTEGNLKKMGGRERNMRKRSNRGKRSGSKVTRGMRRW
jgi:hypothetical protein